MVENQPLMYVLKPLVILTLSVNYFVSANKINAMYVLVLAFQLIGDFIFVREDLNSFMTGIGFFFMINILMSLIVIKRIGVISPKDIFRIFVPLSITILTIVYLIFASVGFMKILVLTFTLTIALLLSASAKYYLFFRKESSKWILLGVFCMIICYMSAGAIRLIKADIVISISESSSYCIYVFCYSRFVALEEKSIAQKKVAYK